MPVRSKSLTAIVFDWAGTTIDHGSCAPAISFQRAFANRGVTLSQAQIREPMGMAKREHIAAIARMPSVSAAWQALFGTAWSETDIDEIYEDFLPLQMQVLQERTQVIHGTLEAVAQCREMGLAIGSTTGYTRKQMEIVASAARHQGYEPDLILCAEDARVGRPAPYLIYETAIRLQQFPLWTIVKVDDTVVGVQAGRNAGCWTIGICCTGNLVGLDEHDFAALTAEQSAELCREAAIKLMQAGAHYTAHSIADVPNLLRTIETRAASGERP